MPFLPNPPESGFSNSFVLPHLILDSDTFTDYLRLSDNYFAFAVYKARLEVEKRLLYKVGEA